MMNDSQKIIAQILEKLDAFYDSWQEDDDEIDEIYLNAESAIATLAEIEIIAKASEHLVHSRFISSRFDSRL
jgi:hypothetical protein